MKLSLFSFLILLISLWSNAQNAVNFSCNDCNGVNHDLFTELEAGNVVVLCWVMPCGACVGPSLTAQNVVNSFDITHPGRVHLYLVDDFANTNCTSLGSWATSNHITNAVKFSDASIDMTDYGIPGMPKIVVTGGTDHHVFLNVNGTVDPTELQDSITSALNSFTSGVEEFRSGIRVMTVITNPSSDVAQLLIKSNKPGTAAIEILDIGGAVLARYSDIGLENGTTIIPLETSFLPSGIYLVRVMKGSDLAVSRLSVIH
jgi:hypothetical protein